MNDSTSLSLFCHRFSPGEMQVVVAGSLGHDLASIHLADALLPQLQDKNSALRAIIMSSGLKINTDKLLKKLEMLSVKELLLLQRAVASASNALHANPEAIFGPISLPCLSVLRVAGLVSPTDKPAYGLIIVSFDDEGYREEIVLRHASKIENCDLSGVGIMERAERVVELVSSARADIDGAAAELMEECYGLASASGLRLARVNVRAGKVSLTEIPVIDLQRDIRDQSLKGLVLQGVNAPPPSN